MKLYIKNMVSLRCKMMVEQELHKIGVQQILVNLGSVDLLEEISQEQKNLLKANLKVSGLELIEDRKSIIIERIKNTIVEMVHYSEELPKVNYSDYISEKLGYVYAYLANVFSEVKGITIQQFIIINKIERVKELLNYHELNLTEISHKLHYSSVAHLSNQFKKITGFTPSVYLKQNNKQKLALDSF